MKPILKSSFSLGIRGKLIAGFSAIILTLIISVATTLSSINGAEKDATDRINTKLPSFSYLLDLDKDIHHSHSLLQTWISTGEQKYKNNSDAMIKHIQESISKLNTLSVEWTEKEKIVWKNIEEMVNKYFKIQNSVNSLSELKENNNKVAKELNTLTNDITTALRGEDDNTSFKLGGLIGDKFDEINRGGEKIIQDMSSMKNTGYFLIFFGLFISLFIALYTTQKILIQINRFRNHARKVASGDFTQKIEIVTNDEIGQLGSDLNVMTEKLASISKQTNDMCAEIVTMLEEVKRASENQSAGSIEQASSISQITTSLDEIEKSSSQTLDKAKLLDESARQTGKKSELGRHSVDLSIQGMRAVRDKVQVIAQTILDLSTQTQQVGEITAVVNTLAQQSKMLALNASIEAAKAGEAGRGFAVVAAEVKNLAEQSEQSTSQVQKILEDIRHATEKAVMATEEGTKKVDEGTQLAEQTGKVVEDLSEMINESQIAAQKIQASVLQENVGIEQITTGMNEINQVTSSFLESIKQSNESIENLRKIAKNLKSHVNTYKY